MNYKCAICGAALIIHRIDDAEIICKVEEDGSLKELSHRSDGSTTIHCEKGIHAVPIKVQDKLLLTFDEYY